MGGLLMKLLQKAACTVNNKHAGNIKGGPSEGERSDMREYRDGILERLFSRGFWA